MKTKYYNHEIAASMLRWTSLMSIVAIFVALETDGTRGILGFWGALGFILCLQLIFKWLCHICNDNQRDWKAVFFKRILWVSLALMFAMSMSKRMNTDGLETSSAENSGAFLEIEKRKLDELSNRRNNLYTEHETVKNELFRQKNKATNTAVLADSEVTKLNAALAQTDSIIDLNSKIDRLSKSEDWADIQELQSLVGADISGTMDWKTRLKIKGFRNGLADQLSVISNSYGNRETITNKINGNGKQLATRQEAAVEAAILKDRYSDVARRLAIFDADLANKQAIYNDLEKNLAKETNELHGLNSFAFAAGGLIDRRLKIAGMTDQNYAEFLMILFWFGFGFALQGGLAQLIKYKPVTASKSTIHHAAPVYINEPKNVTPIRFSNDDIARQNILLSNGNIVKTVVRTWNENGWLDRKYTAQELIELDTAKRRKMVEVAITNRLLVPPAADKQTA